MHVVLSSALCNSIQGSNESSESSSSNVDTQEKVEGKSDKTSDGKSGINVLSLLEKVKVTTTKPKEDVDLGNLMENIKVRRKSSNKSVESDDYVVKKTSDKHDETVEEISDKQMESVKEMSVKYDEESVEEISVKQKETVKAILVEQGEKLSDKEDSGQEIDKDELSEDEDLEEKSVEGSPDTQSEDLLEAIIKETSDTEVKEREITEISADVNVEVLDILHKDSNDSDTENKDDESLKLLSKHEIIDVAEVSEGMAPIAQHESDEDIETAKDKSPLTKHEHIDLVDLDERDDKVPLGEVNHFDIADLKRPLLVDNKEDTITVEPVVITEQLDQQPGSKEIEIHERTPYKHVVTIKLEPVSSRKMSSPAIQIPPEIKIDNAESGSNSDSDIKERPRAQSFSGHISLQKVSTDTSERKLEIIPSRHNSDSEIAEMEGVSMLDVPSRLPRNSSSVSTASMDDNKDSLTIYRTASSSSSLGDNVSSPNELAITKQDSLPESDDVSCGNTSGESAGETEGKNNHMFETEESKHTEESHKIEHSISAIKLTPSMPIDPTFLGETLFKKPEPEVIKDPDIVEPVPLSPVAEHEPRRSVTQSVEKQISEEHDDEVFRDVRQGDTFKFQPQMDKSKSVDITTERRLEIKQQNQQVVKGLPHWKQDSVDGGRSTGGQDRRHDHSAGRHDRSTGGTAEKLPFKKAPQKGVRRVMPLQKNREKRNSMPSFSKEFMQKVGIKSKVV